MNITLEFLQQEEACDYGIRLFKIAKETNVIKLCEKAINKKRLDCAFWLIYYFVTDIIYIQKLNLYVLFLINKYNNTYYNELRPILLGEKSTGELSITRTRAETILNLFRDFKELNKDEKFIKLAQEGFAIMQSNLAKCKDF